VKLKKRELLAFKDRYSLSVLVTSKKSSDFLFDKKSEQVSRLRPSELPAQANVDLLCFCGHVQRAGPLLHSGTFKAQTSPRRSSIASVAGVARGGEAAHGGGKAAPVTPNPETRIPKPESRNWNLESRVPNPESRIPNPETLNHQH